MAGRTLKILHTSMLQSVWPFFNKHGSFNRKAVHFAKKSMGFFSVDLILITLTFLI